MRALMAIGSRAARGLRSAPSLQNAAVRCHRDPRATLWMGPISFRVRGGYPGKRLLHVAAADAGHSDVGGGSRQDGESQKGSTPAPHTHGGDACGMCGVADCAVHAGRRDDGGSSSGAAAATPEDGNVAAKKEIPCWSCGLAVNCHKFFCGCGAVQPVECNGLNYYELFGCPMSVLLDPKTLESRFRVMQKQFHPDLYGTKSEQEREVSLANATQVNQAYQTLRHPLLRIRYLLKVLGIDALEEASRRPVEPELLMEMMEIRERLESPPSAGELEGILAENEAAVRRCLETCQAAFRRGDVAALEVAAVRLQYLYRVREEAERVEEERADAAEAAEAAMARATAEAAEAEDDDHDCRRQHA